MTEKANAAWHGRRVPIAPALLCPKCQGAMRTYVRGGIVIGLCEGCRGTVPDAGELERLIDVEGGERSGIVGEPVDPPGWLWTAGTQA
jgi:Transcription factor zinc-finger